MRIAFVVERPTQFEAPFYRHAANDPANRLRVIYTDPKLAEPAFDPEMGRTVSWGFDLLAGYDHIVLPPRDRARWLAGELCSCDLAIVNGYTRLPYLLAAVAARRAGVPAALRLDSVLFTESPSRLSAKRILFNVGMKRMYDLFFGVGTLTLEYLRALGVPEERMGLFPYAVDVEAFRRGSDLSPEERAAVRERLGVPAGAKVLLCLTKLNPREAPWELVSAFARGTDPRRWLLIAGDGPSRPDLEAAVRERGLRQVRFLGYVPYPRLPELYAAADLFLHPVAEERWGVSVAEAMACGLPAVTSSRVGAARDLIVPERNGFTYPVGDDGALAWRIDQALLLPPAQVREANRSVLARWDYEAAWRGILSAAARLQTQRETR
ncbi:MAG TPA: glycosyltransferase [Thermoanaerobaculia bacterium]